MTRIGRDSAYNLAGHAAPLIAAFFALPVILGGLGAERFALLAITSSILSFAAVVDSAVARLITRQVALREEVSATFRAARRVQLLVGSAAGALLAVAGPALVTLLGAAADVRGEAQALFVSVACSLPLVLVTGCYRAVLEGERKFALVNLLRVPSAVATFVFPAIGATVGWTLGTIGFVLLAVRALTLVVHGLASRRLLPRSDRSSARYAAVIRFAGGMVMANAALSAMPLLDRFILARAGSLDSVAAFSLAVEIVSRAWLIPASFGAAAFPLIAAGARNEDFLVLFRSMLRKALVVVLPSGLALAFVVPALLPLWLGAALPADSAGALAILAGAFVANSVGVLAVAALQACDAVRQIAYARIAMLPLYVVVQLIITEAWGVSGAATGVLIRSIADVGLLSVLLIATRSRFATLPRRAVTANL